MLLHDDNGALGALSNGVRVCFHQHARLRDIHPTSCARWSQREVSLLSQWEWGVLWLCVWVFVQLRFYYNANAAGGGERECFPPSLSLSASYLMLGGAVGGGVWSKHGVELPACGRESAVNTEAVTRGAPVHLAANDFKRHRRSLFFLNRFTAGGLRSATSVIECPRADRAFWLETRDRTLSWMLTQSTILYT